MTSDLLTIRCPKDLLQAIDERVKTEGKRKTDVVIQALRAGLGIEETRQNGFGSTANSNGSHPNNDYLDKQFEERERKLEARFNEIVARLVQQNEEVVQLEVKQAKEEVFKQLDILIQQKLGNVQQLVKQSSSGVQHPNFHSSEGVQHSVKHNVQHNQSSDDEYLVEGVKQLAPVVQHNVQHAVQPEVDNVQQTVKQNIQHIPDSLQHPQPEVLETVKHDVRQNVQQNEDSVKRNVQQNVRQDESQAIQRLEDNVKQLISTVQQNVKHSAPQDYRSTGKDVQHSESGVQHFVQQSEDANVDDAAFVSDTAEDEEVRVLCEVTEEPRETPDSAALGLPDGETTGERLPTSPAATAKKVTGDAASREAVPPIVTESAPNTQSPARKRRKRSAATVEEGQFTRDQLGEVLGIKRSAVKAREDNGELDKLGWERVAGTGTSNTNPALYQRKLEA